LGLEIFGVFVVGDYIIVERLDIGEGEKLGLYVGSDIGAFHEKLLTYLVGPVEILLG
jgi:hypothetical protein